MRDIYFDESIILLDLEAGSKEEVLTAMASNLEEKGLIKSSYLEAVIAREEEFATGLPTNGVSVAIPHTDVEHVNTKTISVAVLKKPVEFGVMGDPNEMVDVELVFMLAMDKADSQLNLLQNLMQIFQNEETLKFLANEKDKTKIVNLLENKLDFSF
ncbi:PTS sugar transporter subunit IIA [Salinicoccus halodurans]|uniref:PTS sugar transporter subunit IIA n=1 Tax=Salinicoccus halodurans TaxID=407035 RepID=A0A0F7HN09_9STAP|nr:PTS sugar transporter subunit IIA [Salinicoccus halodurans]AKG74943.1 PTS sugar transporter subunit IIA [Salinicoccus halodurans]SFK68055.1 PTS system IIA component, Gat family [Salinicoccus halodurans]